MHLNRFLIVTIILLMARENGLNCISVIRNRLAPSLCMKRIIRVRQIRFMSGILIQANGKMSGLEQPLLRVLKPAFLWSTFL